MDMIDDWADYVYDVGTCVREENWDELSLKYVSDELTTKYKDKLNWSMIATNWPISQAFYEKFKQELAPHTSILRVRQQHGFISLSL